MENNNQFIIKWREHVLNAAEALKNHDYETYEAEMHEMENVYEELRKDEELSYNGEQSFGLANEMFESALPSLFMNNKRVIKEYTNMIKGDKNLYAQYMFYEALKNYKEDFNKADYLQEAFTLAMQKINPKTITESNSKLYSFIRKNNIKPSEFINEDNVEFYRLCDIIFTNPKSLSMLSKLNETFIRISNLLTETNIVKNKRLISNAKVTSVKEFVEKYNKVLTEAEKKFINTLLNAKDEKKQKQLYESYKNDCVDKVNILINESSDNSTKQRLVSLIENISNKQYNKNAIIADVIKILEINEILNN